MEKLCGAKPPPGDVPHGGLKIRKYIEKLPAPSYTESSAVGELSQTLVKIRRKNVNKKCSLIRR